MAQEISFQSKQRISIGAWVLIGLQFMAILGIITDGRGSEPALGSHLVDYAAVTSVSAFDYFVGNNIFPIAAIVAGWTLWKQYKCSEGRAIIGTGAVAIIIGSAIIFF